MSTSNITNIELAAGGLAVLVTFKCHGGEQRTYLYSSLEAVAGILNNEDPAQWHGVRVDGAGGGIGGENVGGGGIAVSGTGGAGIAGDFGTVAEDIAEAGEAIL